MTVIRALRRGGHRLADWLDRRVWGGVRRRGDASFRGLAHFDRFFDTTFVDGTFDKGCEELATGGGLLARVQTGRVQLPSAAGAGCRGAGRAL